MNNLELNNYDINNINNNSINNSGNNSVNNLDIINNRIQIERPEHIDLSDKSLLTEYKNSKAFINRQDNISNIMYEIIHHRLSQYIDNEIVEDLTYIISMELVDNLVDYIIPTGVKGSIRGNKFNLIVKNFILNIGLDPNIFDIQFEKCNAMYMTDEKPDWYIFNKITNKILIGMNQIDLWGGGAQYNRAMKYLNYQSNGNDKLICVVYNNIKITQRDYDHQTKKYKIFDTGFRNNTICYLGGLENIINQYFNITEEDNCMDMDIDEDNKLLNNTVIDNNQFLFGN